MKLLIISDLHVDHAGVLIHEQDYDLAILSGDVGNGSVGLEWVKARLPKDKPIFYVPGNHEFYNMDYHQYLEYAEAQTAGTNIIFANRKTFEQNGIKLIGATLWTDFNLDQSIFTSTFYAKRRMNDFIIAHYEGAPLMPEQTIKFHEQDLEFIKNEIDPTKINIVVTHHVPCTNSIDPKYKGDPLNPAFTSDLSDVIDKFKPQYWIHGHTHSSFRYRIYDTEVICNPRGYCSRGTENPEFNPGLILEV